nr:endolytic transglycosylase MltG [Garicola koreensis]
MLKRRQAKRRRRNITLTIALAGFAVLVISFVLIVNSFLGDDTVNDYETQAGETIEFQVVEGDGFESVANRLVEQDIIASGDAFWDALDELDNEPTPQAGSYEVREQMPAEDAVAALFDDSPAARYVALNPGIQIDDALAAIAEGTHLELEELEELNANPQQFGLPEEAESLEGYLAPGEYRPALDATAEEVIEAAVAPTFETLEELNITDEQQQWRTVIIASLITAEANHEQPDDYPLIAGAIENRLQPDNTETDGLLQIDAAVNYGLEGETGLHFSDEDRQDDSNPYNTYQNEGLPPGPIAAPTVDTLEAAANPADTDYYYWVTVNVATGETEFNETYAEHQQDVQEFLRWCREEDDEGLCGSAEVEAAEDMVEE